MPDIASRHGWSHYLSLHCTVYVHTCQACVPFSFVLLQSSYVKQMRPGCFCVLVCGIGFAKAVQALEDGGAKISWNTFKECGTLFPPEIEHVYRYIQTKAANIPELKKLIFTLRLNELWSQCFMNPNIPETVLHSTRSMLHTYAHLLRCPHVCFTHVGKPLPHLHVLFFQRRRRT